MAYVGARDMLHDVCTLGAVCVGFTPFHHALNHSYQLEASVDNRHTIIPSITVI